MSAKQKVISRLLNSESPKDIADSSDVKYATILRYKRELEEAQQNGKVAELIDLDAAAFDAVVAGIEAEGELDVAITELAKSKNSAMALQENLIRSAEQINKRIGVLVRTVDNIGELGMLTESLCALNDAFFNKNTTQVNVQNNYDSSNRSYSAFLGDDPRVIDNGS